MLAFYLCVYSQDDLKFMRIRTKRHEIMISPGMSISFASIRNTFDSVNR